MNDGRLSKKTVMFLKELQELEARYTGVWISEEEKLDTAFTDLPNALAVIREIERDRRSLIRSLNRANDKVTRIRTLCLAVCKKIHDKVEDAQETVDLAEWMLVLANTILTETNECYESEKFKT